MNSYRLLNVPNRDVGCPVLEVITKIRRLIVELKICIKIVACQLYSNHQRETLDH
jgi:hypothetical protein